jgi:large subunit ribosomal protein L29
MAIIRLKEIQGMSSEDRQKKLLDLRAELARMKTMIKAGGAVENPTKVREIRKTIAQILTVENEAKLGIRKGAAAEEEEKPREKAEKPQKPETPEKKAKAKKEEESEETQA